MRGCVTVIALFMLILPFVPPRCVYSQTTARILEQTRSERDPVRRIELLDVVLRNQSLHGRTLSSFFFERAIAYKEINDCFRAIEDFDSALAHSRSAFSALIEKSEC